MNSNKIIDELRNITKNTEDIAMISGTYVNEPLKNMGLFNAIGDYSVTPTDFIYTVTQETNISRLIVFIEDQGTSFRQDRYGSLGAALIVGIKVFYDIGAGRVYINNDIPIKTNGLWASLGYDVFLQEYGSGDKSLTARITFQKSGVFINLPTAGIIGVELNDSFLGLVNHFFQVQGHIVS